MDSTTYYVQAVIRDGNTDALIDTVNLTDQGNRRFTKPWRVPSDPTGEGRDILITYTVYTDSGYTTKSESHEENFLDYRIEHIPRHGGGGGVDVDYKKVRKIIEEEVKKIILPDLKDIDLSPLSESLQAILSEVRAIEIPEAEKVNWTPLIAKFDAIERSLTQAIEGKDVTPETDLSPLLEEIVSLRQQVDNAGLDKTQESAAALLERIKEFFTKDLEMIQNQVATINKTLNQIPVMMLTGPRPEQQPQQVDYSQLNR